MWRSRRAVQPLYNSGLFFSVWILSLDPRCCGFFKSSRLTGTFSALTRLKSPSRNLVYTNFQSPFFSWDAKRTRYRTCSSSRAIMHASVFRGYVARSTVVHTVFSTHKYQRVSQENRWIFQFKMIFRIDRREEKKNKKLICTCNNI
jgi:hypothetical protein